MSYPACRSRTRDFTEPYRAFVADRPFYETPSGGGLFSKCIPLGGRWELGWTVALAIMAEGVLFPSMLTSHHMLSHVDSGLARGVWRANQSSQRFMRPFLRPKGCTALRIRSTEPGGSRNVGSYLQGEGVRATRGWFAIVGHLRAGSNMDICGHGWNGREPNLSLFFFFMDCHVWCVWSCRGISVGCALVLSAPALLFSRLWSDEGW